MIGTRTLKVMLPTGERDVLVTLENPQQSDGSWVCAYEIDWPGRTKRMFARGFDALQATHLAMQMVGAELYSSQYHEEGKLRWGKPGEGYGFPVPVSIRSLLIGEDKKFEG